MNVLGLSRCRSREVIAPPPYPVLTNNGNRTMNNNNTVITSLSIVMQINTQGIVTGVAQKDHGADFRIVLVSQETKAGICLSQPGGIDAELCFALRGWL